MNPNLKPFALKKPVKKLKVRKPIRRRTTQRAADEAKYRRRVKLRLATEVPVCKALLALGHIALANQCHHKYGRRGRLLNWEKGWIFVSQAGHDFIQKNPEQARMLGLLCEVGQWNNQSLAK